MNFLSKIRSTFFLSIFCFGLALLVAAPYLKTAFPYTHDGENHLARFANYKQALKEGQLPPRFAPNLMNHYGYPVFNFNYPLANILSIPFSLAKISYELTFKIELLFFLTLGAAGAWYWLSELHFSTKSKLFALSAMMVTPFLVSTVIYRGNIGEIAAWSLLSWMFWIVEKVKKEESFSNSASTFLFLFLMAAFSLSHNLTVFFSIPFLALYSLQRLGFMVRAWLKLLLLSIVTAANASWFWLPAILEKDQIILDGVSLSKTYLDHLSSLPQLVWMPIQFGFSRPGSVDTLAVGIGWLLALLLALGWGYVLSQKWKYTSIQFLLLIIVSSTLLLEMKGSELIWNVLPLGNLIQFPWRLSLFVIVISLPILAKVFSTLPKFGQHVLLLLLLIQVLGVSKLKAVDYFHKLNLDYELFSQSTSTNNENLPKTFSFTDIATWQPAPTLLPDTGEVRVAHWQGSDRTYQLTLNEESTVIEPTMYFSGWQTTVNEQKIEYLFTDETAGRIAFSLPSGDYFIHTRFTQLTWPRLLGNSISTISLLSCMCWAVFSRLKARRTYV